MVTMFLALVSGVSAVGVYGAGFSQPGFVARATSLPWSSYQTSVSVLGSVQTLAAFFCSGRPASENDLLDGSQRYVLPLTTWHTSLLGSGGAASTTFALPEAGSYSTRPRP